LKVKSNGGMALHDIGKRIREIRKLLRYTQEQLARELGVSSTTVSAYEVGDAIPPMRTLEKLTEIADVSYDWLCAGCYMARDPENKIIQITPEELRLLKNFRQATPEYKELISKLVEAITSSSKNNAS
jgi:transcriptional regulator with XRE-family HTH domain